MTDENSGLSEHRMAVADFWTSCTANNIMLSVEQLEHLERYEQELRYWNAKVNMISRKDESNIWEKHILHSLTLLKYVQIPQKARVLDVGTGGGLPGVPLKIARPDVHMLMVDSIRKKLQLAEMFAQHTALKDFSARVTRAEELAKEPHYLKHFNVIVSRAVTVTTELLTWVRPLLKPNGFCAFLKGGNLTDELAMARNNHPGVIIEEIPIDLVGVPGFFADEKKVITCRFV